MPKPCKPSEATAPGCGFWPAPLSAKQVAQASVSLDQIQLQDEAVYWRESKPREGGRFTLCRWTNDAGVVELLKPPFSVRSRVHEYGGGEWCLGDHHLYFVNAEDQQVYQLDLQDNTHPRQITDAPNTRFADLQYDAVRQQLVCITEEHSNDSCVINRLACIDINNGSITVLHEGCDFYASPALSGDGAHLAWLSWNHPHMPWTASQLYRAKRSDKGELHSVCALAERPGSHAESQSFFQPQFSPSHVLHCVNDRSGWWNIHHYPSADRVHPVHQANAEFGLAQWCFGLRTYDFLDDNTLVCSYLDAGINRLAKIGSDGECQPLALDFDHFRSIRCHDNLIYCIAASATRLPAVVRIDPDTGQTDILRGGEQPVPEAYLSRPRHISYDVDANVRANVRADAVAHGYYYPPQNADVGKDVSKHDKPPIVVFTHGGPTASTYPVLNLTIQYWTQRGFAVADLNYRGSAGYGRAYRQALHLNWGSSDVDDCVAAIDYLAGQGLVDKENAFIRGNSAGGYTTLCALTFTDRFKAGASLYGISDPARLSVGTHKFESHYLDWLIGDVVKDAGRYASRTPLFHADDISCPVLFFQGGLDKVVLPDQTLDMVNALKAKGVLTACHLFPEEYHGFQHARNQQTVLEAELTFYQAVL